MTPTVSIIIPTYNRATIISETLASIQQQTFTNWECIVVDDGSTDNTPEVVHKFVTTDRRFQYHKRPDSVPKGANGCRNYGYSLSEGNAINWLDSDDLFSKDKLAAQIDRVNTLPEDSKWIVSCKWNRFRDHIDGITPKETHINRDFSSGIALLKAFNKKASFFPSHAYLVSRSLVEAVAPWNESLLVNQDGEFFSRILIQAEQVLHAEDGMVYYRLPDETSVSNFHSSEKITNVIASWELIEAHLSKVAALSEFPFIDHAKNYIFERINDRKIQRQHPEFFKHQLWRARPSYQWKHKILRFFKKF